MGTVIDLTGQRFGRLEVIKLVGYTNAHKAKWLCKCDCGNYKEIIGSSLRNGKTKSCGCYCHEKIIERNTKHGLEGTKLCYILRNMKSRCSNPNNHAYKNYGGRGITVCKEWADAENGLKNFAEWAYANGYDENAEWGECTLDRIDVNGNYEPLNCRWVNLTIQANNRTNNVIIEYMGEKDTLENWCKRLNLSRSMIRHRLERGCEIEKLFDNAKRKPILITYNGETKSLKEWSEITGIKYETLYSRFNSGWSTERLFMKVKKQWILRHLVLSKCLFLCRKRGENNVRLFDDINDLSERGTISIDEYFEAMELTNEEKKDRKKFAESMEEVMLFIFALFSVMKEYGYQNNDFIIRQLQQRYSETILKFMELDRYLEEYIEKFSKETIDITIKHEGENYYTSDDRATFISENESHFAFSHKEFSDAIKAGKTKKQWMDIRDDRERKTHRAVGRTILPINEPFLVGNSKMMHPKDAETYGADAEEIVNCRCSARYF